MQGSETYVTATVVESTATVILSRGKVNALNLQVVEQLHEILLQIEGNKSIHTIVLTGHGPFFSFGFDIPEFLTMDREEFFRYALRFTELYRYLFTYPKRVIAALNGHAIAGGCMLALACDHRVMVNGKARISLNEVTFGSTVFAGSVEMLRFATGSRNATAILSSGSLFSAIEAERLGLVDVAVDPQQFDETLRAMAHPLAPPSLHALTSLKMLLRRPIAEEFAAREHASIAEFIDLWYSPETRAELRNITIRSA